MLLKRLTAFVLNASKKQIIFVHIPKTAGSSFEQVIHENTPKAQAYMGLRCHLTSNNVGVDLIKGHMTYGIDFVKLRKSRYITFIRNPTERCISYYYFVQEWPKHPAYNDAKNHDIVDFYKIKRYQNIQAKSIGGHVLLPSNIVPLSLILFFAKQRLRDIFDFGVTEYYSQSVELLCATLNWHNRPIVHATRGRIRPLSTSISPDTLQKIADLNYADWQLYHYGKDLFKKRCEELGISSE